MCIMQFEKKRSQGLRSLAEDRNLESRICCEIGRRIDTENQ